MDEVERARRRARHRERRLIKRIQLLAPLLIVTLAWLLSTGIVRVMEVRPEPQPRVANEVAPFASAQPDTHRAMLTNDVLPTLPETLSVSILDHEVRGTREDNRPVEPEPGPGSASELDLLLPQVDGLSPTDYSTIASSSTSKVSAAPGGMLGGAPRSP